MAKKSKAKASPKAVKKTSSPAKPAKTLKTALKAAVKTVAKAGSKAIKAAKETTESSKAAPKATEAKVKPTFLAKAGKEGLTAKAMAQSPVEVLADTAVSTDPDEIILTDAEGRRYCRARDCDQLSRVDGYCRYHYLLFWKKIQVRKKILSDGKLERYIEELTARYPDKYLEILRKDLRSDKDFMAAIGELELEDAANSEDADFEDDNNFIEEMRGVSTSGSEPSLQDDDDY